MPVPATSLDVQTRLRPGSKEKVGMVFMPAFFRFYAVFRGLREFTAALALATAYIEEDQTVMDDVEPIYGSVWLVTTVTSFRWYACTKLPVVRNGAKGKSRGAVIGVAGILTPHEGSGKEPPEYARIRAAITLADRSFASGLRVA